jgi:hypothetical protein
MLVPLHIRCLVLDNIQPTVTTSEFIIAAQSIGRLLPSTPVLTFSSQQHTNSQLPQLSTAKASGPWLSTHVVKPGTCADCIQECSAVVPPPCPWRCHPAPSTIHDPLALPAPALRPAPQGQHKHVGKYTCILPTHKQDTEISIIHTRMQNKLLLLNLAVKRVNSTPCQIQWKRECTLFQ